MTNTELSPAAQKAVSRIRVLRVLSERTGLKTTEEQIKTLLGLEDRDILDVSAVLHADNLRSRSLLSGGPGVANGTRR